MLKLVSWIDSLPRLGGGHLRRKNSTDQNSQPASSQKRRFVKAKSTASTPLIGQSIKKSKKSNPQNELRSPPILNSAIKAIGRRRYTEPDALIDQRPPSPILALSPKLINRSTIDSNFDPMSKSWHPEAIDRRVQSFNKHRNNFYYETKNNLISSNPVSCSVQEMEKISNDEMIMFNSMIEQNYTTLPASRPQIRTNPWCRPKSPRQVPALDLSRSGSLLSQKKKIDKSASDQSRNHGDPTKKSSTNLLQSVKDDQSVYSLRSSSGYGSGASQDSSPASSVHTPDWHHLIESRGNLSISENQKNIDIGLQCDLTEDKSTDCTEEDFLQFLKKEDIENGNIRMIDDDSSDSSDASSDDHICTDQCHRFSSDQPKKSNPVLNVLKAKVELMKVNSDHVSQAVRTAKEEQRKRNGELRQYEEQMQFLKQLKLVISNGFEVLV